LRTSHLLEGCKQFSSSCLQHRHSSVRYGLPISLVSAPLNHMRPVLQRGMCEEFDLLGGLLEHLELTSDAFFAEFPPELRPADQVGGRASYKGAQPDLYSRIENFKRSHICSWAQTTFKPPNGA